METFSYFDVQDPTKDRVTIQLWRDGDFVGAIFLKKFSLLPKKYADPYTPCWQVSAIDVVQHFRRKGYGTKLYQEAARIAAEQGFALCSDVPGSLDPKALAFWEKQVEKGRAVWEVPGPPEEEGSNYDYGRFVLRNPPPASLGASGSAEKKLTDLEVGWKQLGVEIDAYISRGDLHLSRIEMERSLRGRGLGTKAMEDLIHLADEHQLRMTLSPSTDFGGSSVERLKRFYRRFGFVSNKGRHKDFTLSDSMYRLPQGA